MDVRCGCTTEPNRVFRAEPLTGFDPSGTARARLTRGCNPFPARQPHIRTEPRRFHGCEGFPPSRQRFRGSGPARPGPFPFRPCSQLAGTGAPRSFRSLQRPASRAVQANPGNGPSRRTPGPSRPSRPSSCPFARSPRLAPSRPVRAQGTGNAWNQGVEARATKGFVRGDKWFCQCQTQTRAVPKANPRTSRG